MDTGTDTSGRGGVRLSNFRSPLIIHAEGPAVAEGRIAFQDLVRLAQNVQGAVDRIARLISGREPVSKGRRPAEIAQACTIQLVELRRGSLQVVCDLPRDSVTHQIQFLGEMTMVALVGGLRSIAGPNSELPQGFDQGVLLSLRETGKLLSRGIDELTFTTETEDGPKTARYTQAVQDRVIARLTSPPTAGTRTVEGRLLMGDFKESALRCRLHPPLSKPLTCTFDETRKEAVLGALTHYVRVTGEAQTTGEVIDSIRIGDIDIIDGGRLAESDSYERTLPFFDATTDLSSLASAQGIVPQSFDALCGNFWPESESTDDFIATIRDWRREGHEPK